MRTNLEITKYNIAALLGWAAVGLGAVSFLVRIFFNIGAGVWFNVIALVFGGLTITFSGPLKTTRTKDVELKPLDSKD